MNMKLKLLQIGFFLAIQVPAILLAQSDEGDSSPEISISIEEGKVIIVVNLNEPFSWENTKFNSLKTFPMRGGSKMPHTIRIDESNNVNWRQTDIVGPAFRTCDFARTPKSDAKRQAIYR